MELKDLVGEHELSGVDVTHEEVESWNGTEKVEVVRFVLDGVTYKAVEDPDDGYRSRCDELIVCDEKISNIFVPHKVICKMAPDDSDGYDNKDVLIMYDAVTKALVLEIGTGNTDDYYPYCVLNWFPEGLAINAGK
jgi:hypothetical protein